MTERGRDPLLDQLRDANERLVVSAMRAQQSADDADAARTEADLANRLKDEFLATVSHELRTPLSAVLGWARLLGGGKLDPAQTADAIRTIERNTRTLARIIDDLLDVSRLLGGTIRIDAQPVDLVAVIQAAIDGAQPAADVKTVRLTFTSSSVPDPVAGDVLRLQQVLANLLSNAIKFTAAGGHVDVTLRAVGSHAEIRVTDTGQGFDAAFVPHLFERFSQADASTTRPQGGLGLGLAIARALVERHGGTIHGESPGPGLGATFTVRLPVLPPREARAASPGDIDPTAAGVTPVRLDGIRVVLVEDDDDSRQVLTMVLRLAGARVTPAGSVGEAMAVLATSRPDVIVSDIGMPDEDGYSLLRRIRARVADEGGHVPVIAVTGYVRPADRAGLLAAGFQMLLRKPVEPDDMVAAVAAVTTARPSTPEEPRSP